MRTTVSCIHSHYPARSSHACTRSWHSPSIPSNTPWFHQHPSFHTHTAPYIRSVRAHDDRHRPDVPRSHMRSTDSLARSSLKEIRIELTQNQLPRAAIERIVLVQIACKSPKKRGKNPNKEATAAKECSHRPWNTRYQTRPPRTQALFPWTGDSTPLFVINTIQIHRNSALRRRFPAPISSLLPPIRRLPPRSPESSRSGEDWQGTWCFRGWRTGASWHRPMDGMRFESIQQTREKAKQVPYSETASPLRPLASPLDDCRCEWTSTRRRCKGRSLFGCFWLFGSLISRLSPNERWTESHRPWRCSIGGRVRERRRGSRSRTFARRCRSSWRSVSFPARYS